MADVDLVVAVTSAGVPSALASLEKLESQGKLAANSFTALASKTRVAFSNIAREVDGGAKSFLGFDKAVRDTAGESNTLSVALSRLKQSYADLNSTAIGATAAQRLAIGGKGSLTAGLAAARQTQAMQEAFNADPVRDLITYERELAAVEQARMGALSAQKTLATARWERELSAMTPVQAGLARVTRATQELATSTNMMNVATARLAAAGGATTANYDKQAVAALRLAEAERGWVDAAHDLERCASLENAARVHVHVLLHPAIRVRITCSPRACTPARSASAAAARSR